MEMGYKCRPGLRSNTGYRIKAGFQMSKIESNCVYFIITH